MNDLKEKSEILPVSELIKFLVKKIDYKNYLIPPAKARDEQANQRWANILELIGAAKFYDSQGNPEGLGQLLENASLFEATDNVKDKENRALLITMHGAKGMEFDTVFIVGAEEGLIPHHLSLSLPNELEEERRLMYVAITRAKTNLFITFTQVRKLMGRMISNPVSRFVLDLPEENTEVKILSNNYKKGLEEWNNEVEYLDI